jgi:hypothetical protein
VVADPFVSRVHRSGVVAYRDRLVAFVKAGGVIGEGVGGDDKRRRREPREGAVGEREAPAETARLVGPAQEEDRSRGDQGVEVAVPDPIDGGEGDEPAGKVLS